MKTEINKYGKIPQEILDKKLLIGAEGISVGILMDDTQDVWIPLDETSLSAPLFSGEKWTWRDLVGQHPTPDFFLGNSLVKRIVLTVKADGNQILVTAPGCSTIILNGEEKTENPTQSIANQPKQKFIYFRGVKVNLFGKEEMEKKTEQELVRQRQFLMHQLDFNVIATDTNIWIAEEDNNGKKQMKYKHMLLFLGQTQREKAIKPGDDYTFNDYRFEMHNAVYSEINSFSKDMDDARQPMAWSAKCLISDMCKKEGKQLKARLELVVEEAEDDTNKIYADKWIRQYSKNIMIEERLRLLVITNDRDLQIRVNNDCNRDWTDYNKKPENKDKRIRHDLIPVTERGDIIMTITDQIQMIDRVLQERCHSIDNRKNSEKRTY